VPTNGHMAQQQQYPPRPQQQQQHHQQQQQQQPGAPAPSTNLTWLNEGARPAGATQSSILRTSRAASKRAPAPALVSFSARPSRRPPKSPLLPTAVVGAVAWPGCCILMSSSCCHALHCSCSSGADCRFPWLVCLLHDALCRRPTSRMSP
jgi:hypothetical protein